ncbi:hypothetical protein [Nitrincola iocasae]|uniref:Uncharacterized protein n=1 Tax=Nitrincola iocasae TaxID=2614693 RepID=A0A5J6LCP7_9GAMM|nr:hypothetical protein [Nitrincola iocasae]QEW06454.1 hypothetical protein F5I99_07990 [Nitrincola iocasae]
MKLKLGITLSLILVAVVLFIGNQKGTQMARASDYVIDRNYYIVIHSNSAWFNVLVNGINTQLYNSADPFNITLPINHLMQSGENQVTFNFVSVLPGDHAIDEGFGPTQDFSIHISIESVHLETRERERITLIDARYDMETGQIISNEKTIFDAEPVYQQAHMHTTGDLRLKEGFTFVDGEGPDIPSQHLIAAFNTEDRFPRFHWLDEAVVLEDTPALREGLRNSYRHIHGLIEQGDFQGLRQLMDPIWENTAIAMNMGNSADDFISPTTKQNFSSVNPQGQILRPLHFDQVEAPIELDHIQFMADGRLVRILPDPIRWRRPGAREISSSGFVFYVTNDNKWKVADIVM